MRLQFGPDGLAPAVVQDARSGRVLMVAWLNEAAVQATVDTGQVHFWSRSRNELWRKGAGSGNTLTLVEVLPDCDRDVVLIRAVPAGPACHTGSASCFEDAELEGFFGLEGLWKTIRARSRERPSGSYTVSLLEGGVDAVARKLIEEAGEVVLAAKDHATGGDAGRVAEEAADLVYHLLVVLAERGIPPRRVIEELADRAG